MPSEVLTAARSRTILLPEMDKPLCNTKKKFETNDDFWLVDLDKLSCRVIVYTIFKLAADSAPHPHESQHTHITVHINVLDSL